MCEGYGAIYCEKCKTWHDKYEECDPEDLKEIAGEEVF